MRFAEDSDPDQDEHLAGRALVKQKANIRIEAARCGKERGIFPAKAAESNSFALGKGADEGFHSDDEEEESSPGVVDFGGDYASGYQRRPPLKSQYLEKQQGQKGWYAFRALTSVWVFAALRDVFDQADMHHSDLIARNLDSTAFSDGMHVACSQARHAGDKTEMEPTVLNTSYLAAPLCRPSSQSQT